MGHQIFNFLKGDVQFDYRVIFFAQECYFLHPKDFRKKMLIFYFNPTASLNFDYIYTFRVLLGPGNSERCSASGRD